jgi:hypothetical protein
MSNGVHHSANLAITSFMKNHFYDGRAAANNGNFRRSGGTRIVIKR